MCKEKQYELDIKQLSVISGNKMALYDTALKDYKLAVWLWQRN